MNDPLSKTVDEIREFAKSHGLQVFYGWLSESGDEGLAVHWNQGHGGNWESFLECAKSMNANALYLNWVPFEKFQIDEAVERISELAVEEGSDESDTNEMLGKLRNLESNVGLTCIIDLVFVVNGVVHTYQETADWFDEFGETFGEEGLEDDEDEREPMDPAEVKQLATALASDPKYMTSKQREDLLEKIAGEKFSDLPVHEILRKAELIFQAEFRQAAEQRLAEEVRGLREQGLNMNAIAQRLGISRDRVSGLASMVPRKR